MLSPLNIDLNDVLNFCSEVLKKASPYNVGYTLRKGGQEKFEVPFTGFPFMRAGTKYYGCQFGKNKNLARNKVWDKD